MSETMASRITTISRVYLIIALFVALIFFLILLIHIQMDALTAIRTYVGGEGLWAKAQKDAILSLEHYIASHDEADYQAYRRLVQVPLGDQKARIELQKPNPDLDIVRKGYLQGRNHPVDIEYAIPFFRRFQHTAYMSQVIGHWTAADRLIAEMNGVAEAVHDEIASGRASPQTIRAIHARLEAINRQVTVEEDLFSSTLAEASRWANDVSRNLTYAIAFLFAILGVTLSWPIITRIRATESALYESEQKFRSITTSAWDAIVMIDEEGKTVFFNDAAKKMFGYSAEEVIGKELHQLIAPARYLEDYRRSYPRFTKTGEGAAIGKVIELGALRKEGSEFPIELSLSAMRIKGRWNAVCIIRDISERKQAEEALRVSSLKHQLLFESSRDALMTLAPPSWKFTGANKATLQLFGAASVDEFTALGPWNVSPERQPDGRLSGEKAQEMIATAMREGSNYFEWEHQRLDGLPFAADVLLTRMEVGKELFLQATVRDITERKQAEEALRVSSLKHQLLFESSRDALMTLAPPSWKFTGANKATLQLFGAASVDEFTALGPWNVSPERQPDGRLSGEKAQEMIATAMREGSNYFEWEHQRLDGQPFAADVLLTRMEVGRDLFLQATVRDITERKQAEEKIRQLNDALKTKVQERTQQLLEAQEELVRKEKLAVLGQVAGSVGHELRNPLGVMSNAVFFLQTVLTDADDSVKEYLGVIKNEIAGSARIVSDLLDAVRTKQSQPQVVEVREAIRLALDMLTMPPTVVVKLDIPESLPALWVDSQQINMVLCKLISNSVDAMPEGGVLEIKAREDTQARSITVSVKDSGVGIAPENLAKVFQPLYTTKARGIGLGLVVVKNLTEANGGRVDVQSEPGKGATFSITLPGAGRDGEAA